ncbi:MAG: hypothetical protein RIR53_1851 [Bacteroidota bacterium]|jgi:hypothetical protein
MNSTYNSSCDASVVERVAERLHSNQSLALPPDLERIDRLIDQLGDFAPDPYIIPLSALTGPSLRNLAK